MRIFHVAAECYPAAKAGGLGDVLGALPKYIQDEAHEASVIIPGYHTSWILSQTWNDVYTTLVRLNTIEVPIRVLQCANDKLGFSLFTIDIPGFFDRPGIYADPKSGFGYSDEIERNILFQQAALKFIQHINSADIIHCHDHHTGLIPFMVKHCPEFKSLENIPTVFTIHNGQYHGAFSWDKSHLLPWYDGHARGLLDWGNTINPLATGIKCCWKLTTVSNGYLNEIQYQAKGLESLIRQELGKAVGIVNGIDTKVWNPRTDPMIKQNLKKDISTYKYHNKIALKEQFKFDENLPLITFIGRLVYEKGADLLPDAIAKFLYEGGKAAFIVLGTGDPGIRDAFLRIKPYFENFFDTSIGYNEQLSHQLYAGSDFLVMPSRVEPCGLNQLYAFKYGTIPIVRNTGGLSETVQDISEDHGNGIKFNDLSIDAITSSFRRAAELYTQKEYFNNLRKDVLNLDFSWEKAASNYLTIYTSLNQLTK